MQNMPDRPQRLALYRVDQRPHPRMEHLGPRHAVGIALAPLGGMLGGAALAIVHRLAREQRVPLRGKAPLLSQLQKDGEQIVGQMSLRPSARSEEGRVGKEWGRKGSTRGCP